MNKALLVLIANKPQWSFYKLFSACFEDVAKYKTFPFSIEKYASVFYAKEPYQLSRKIKNKKRTTAKGLRGLIYKIILLPGIKHIVVFLLSVLEQYLNILSRIIKDKKHVAEMNKKIAELVCQENVAAIIMFGTPWAPNEAMFFPRTHLPCISIPSCTSLNPNYYFKSKRYEDYQSYGTLLRFFIKKIAPAWVHDIDGKQILPGSPVALLSALFCGVSRKETASEWFKKIDGLCFHSAREKYNLSQYGTIPEAWPILGELTSDLLVQGLNNKVDFQTLTKNSAATNFDRTIMFDLKNFSCVDTQYLKEICNIAFEAQSKGWNILFCPHPRCPEETKEFCISKGLPVSELSTFEVIPFADLYVTCGGSTCIWAAQLGIPTISYDIFQLCTGSDVWEGGFTYSYLEKQNFLETLVELLQDPVKYKNLKDKAEKAKHEMGITDGRCRERIINYIDELIKTKELAG